MGNRAGGAHAFRQVEEKGLFNSAAFRSYEKIYAGSDTKEEGKRSGGKKAEKVTSGNRSHD